MDFETRRAALETEMGEPITVDFLTRTFKIFQRKRGHRHSTDDLLTGFYGVVHAPAAPAAHAHLDLGTGIGSVGLLVHAVRPDLALTCIEAQDVSFRLLLENVAANGLEGKVRTLHGDLRDLALEERFALVTGSPPYFDPSAGIVPADSQKAHARFELRGDVSDYARAARRHLAPGGRFVLCFPFAQKSRALAALAGEGFSLASVQDVVPREGLAPLFSLFAASLEGCEPRYEAPLVVRDARGAHSEEMHAIRGRFGFDPQR